MESHIDFREAVDRIQARDARFHEDLYPFVMEALEYTYMQMGVRRHISAGELIQGLCKFAKDVFGVMAFTFLQRWGVRSTGDIGIAVFHLIDEGVLSRREKEKVEDFENVLDLQEILEEKYFN
jgi:uncharacterized repeat protein (TIGR04138 family)